MNHKQRKHYALGMGVGFFCISVFLFFGSYSFFGVDVLIKYGFHFLFLNVFGLMGIFSGISGLFMLSYYFLLIQQKQKKEDATTIMDEVSVAKRLARLEEAHDQGLVSDEEYVQTRQKIMEEA